MEALIAPVLERLRTDISAANVAGNIEGLLARHLLGDDPRLGFDWSVDCGPVWLESSYDPSSLPSVAALAFTVARRSNETMLTSLETGLKRAIGRDASAAASSVALHSPPVLVGLILAAEHFKERKPHYLSWCRDVIQALRVTSSGKVDALVVYAGVLAGVAMPTSVNVEGSSASELAAQEWLLSLPSAEARPAAQRKALKQALVEQAMREDIGNRTAHDAALIWHAVQCAISEATSDLLRSPATVVHMLEQFESSMKRWRWDPSALKTPIRWPLLSEREVQDILYLMLRPVFLDLEDEDTLPKFGHSTYRADFGIPSLGLLVEAKYSRSAADFKAIEKEVLEDIVPYLQTPERYSRIVVFIYDHSASVQVHETTARALRRAPGIEGVVIASRPSHLPVEQLTVASETKPTGRAKGPAKPASKKSLKS
ncbi:hypothetical protein [Hydrogenophaga sp. PBL-H3]|uniref:PD-(D/E)XK nuclease domain-containing protein n=1 Tax=Hydrogenophaga sp. PBL-H3 TaxID=434010 RepID=UPI00131FC2BB|nr:hypothetical protein [Hydrogenophaga sp. PBL-H3]QHE75526.1 hypothetical protein F9Z45_05390 [Hydrogenophaga sp. PBL-H3]QHE79952.1 hypothetical protein F9Z44_05390 [Hydrogenophaga sp. PBL-H3]